MSDGLFVNGVVFAAWFLGGFINGVTGMGAAVLAIPLLACAAEMTVVVPSGCIVGACIVVFVACMYWKACDWRMAFAMFLGSFPGTFLGVAVLTIAPGAVLQAGLGTLLVAYVLWQLVAHRWVRVYRESWLGAFGAGFCGGFGNGSTTIGGPPVAVYTTLVGWDKDKVRGTMSCYFLLNSCLTLVLQWRSGLYTPEVWSVALWGIPGACAGLLLSLPVARRIRQDTFQRMLFAIIGGGGILLLVRSYT